MAYKLRLRAREIDHFGVPLPRDDTLIDIVEANRGDGFLLVRNAGCDDCQPFLIHADDMEQVA